MLWEKEIEYIIWCLQQSKWRSQKAVWLWWRRINEASFFKLPHIHNNKTTFCAVTYCQPWLMRSPSRAQRTETKSRNSSVDKRQDPSPLYNIGNSCYPAHLKPPEATLLRLRRLEIQWYKSRKIAHYWAQDVGSALRSRDTKTERRAAAPAPRLSLRVMHAGEQRQLLSDWLREELISIMHERNWLLIGGEVAHCNNRCNISVPAAPSSIKPASTHRKKEGTAPTYNQHLTATFILLSHIITK